MFGLAAAMFFIAIARFLRGIMTSFVPGQVHIRVGRKDIGLDVGSGGRLPARYGPVINMNYGITHVHQCEILTILFLVLSSF